MVKVFYATLFTTTLSLVSISPSFSMDPPEEEQEKLSISPNFSMDPPEEGQEKLSISPSFSMNQKDRETLHLLGRTYFHNAGTQYSLAVVKEYFRKLIASEGNVVQSAQHTRYTEHVRYAQYAYAMLHIKALTEQSTEADKDVAYQLMRKAAIAGSKDAKDFRKVWGLDIEDYNYAMKCFESGDENAGENLMIMLAAEGFEKAQKFIETGGGDLQIKKG